MTIGQRIKSRRNELGWSQRELSDRMGYSNHSTITKIEAGKVDIPQSRIVQFAEVLGLSIADLMGWTEDIEAKPVEMANKMADFLITMEGDDGELMTMLIEYKTLSDTKKAQVREYVKLLAGKG